jgi:hypothetical protein
MRRFGGQRRCSAAFPKADGSAVNTFFKAKIEER